MNKKQKQNEKRKKKEIFYDPAKLQILLGAKSSPWKCNMYVYMGLV